MTQKYIISDHHFCHKNIIGYENRPFKDELEMNNYMVEKWNEVVGKKDIVYHLGDFCFGNEEIIKYWFNKLNGRKIIILGNHDRRINKNPSFWRGIGFEEVYNYPIIITNKGYKAILSHEPILDYEFKFLNIHGHIHTKNLESFKLFENIYYNVSVELCDYKPILLEKI